MNRHIARSSFVTLQNKFSTCNEIEVVIKSSIEVATYSLIKEYKRFWSWNKKKRRKAKEEENMEF